MSAEQQIKEEVGTLISGMGPRPVRVSIPISGDATPEQRLDALEHDIQALYRGLLLAGRQIDHLSRKISGG
jgi:hypothetical protein